MAVNHGSRPGEASVYRCDAPGCVSHAQGSHTGGLPQGWLVVDDANPQIEPLHLCGWRCLTTVATRVAPA